jgi:hypothetical protein
MPNLRALRDMVEDQVDPRIKRRPALRPSPAAACRRGGGGRGEGAGGGGVRKDRVGSKDTSQVQN